MEQPKTIEKSRQYLISLSLVLLIYKGNYSMMNKARIVLSTVALFTITGGTLAFKNMRTGFPIFTTTTAVNAFGTFYTLAGGATFYYTSPSLFFAPPPNDNLLHGILTTTAPATQTLTLTRAGGTQTITIPNYGTVTALTTTRVTAAD